MTNAANYSPDEVRTVLAVDGLRSNRMNGSEIVLACPFCGKKKFSVNTRKNGISHCMNAACPSNGKGYNLISIHGYMRNLSNREAVEDIKKILHRPADAALLPEKPAQWQAPVEEKIASPEKLDAAYSAVLEDEIFRLAEDHFLDLRWRGMPADLIARLQFRTFPHFKQKGENEGADPFAFCRRLQTKGIDLRGVPGFYQCRNGAWTVATWVKRGIVMPTRDIHNRIVGLQIRVDNALISEGEGKCVWLSSKGRNHGTPARAGIHFAFDFKLDAKGQEQPVIGDSVVLTEGMMKAEVIHYFQPDFPVLSVPGVDSTSRLPETLKALKALGVKQVMLGFDMDYQTNENVAAAMEKTRRMIVQSGLQLWKSPSGKDFMSWDVDLPKKMGHTDAPPLKGLDDLQAFIKKGILPGRRWVKVNPR